jgi:guanosine-3',5'-bis(diphosphate) 3'-pyrophosphohydrolase
MSDAPIAPARPAMAASARDDEEIVELFAFFEGKLTGYPAADRARILAAARWARALHGDQRRASGDPYVIHPLNVASILVDLRMDPDVLIAALLHDVLEDTDARRTDLRKEFGREVEALVQGVTKISILRGRTRSARHAETIRKMLFAMVKDLRVILIKLADKVHNMRTLGYLDEEDRKRIAQETLDIYAPLAGRLGISRVKDELEDLSLKHLQPQVYDQIRQFVAARKEDRDGYLARVGEAITREAAAAGIPVTLETRAKHFYSIYQKMRRRAKPLEEIYDMLGIRVLCDTTSQCYELLGHVHKLWMPIEGRFKDYIAMPKSNRYQSLHTTVMGWGGRVIEIQIRTHEMHATAENGIASHWLYKSRTPAHEAAREKDLSLIAKLREWQSAEPGSSDFLDEIKRELLGDSIYVFTPKGDVVELPYGSTAVDFAYHIHTDIGDHCLAAKADGAIIPLREPLRNTQVVEIVTAVNARPHLDWLRSVRTSRARSKIRHWLAQNDPQLIFDRNLVAKKRPAPAAAPAPPATPASRDARAGGPAARHPHRRGPQLHDPHRPVLLAEHGRRHRRLRVPGSGHHGAPGGLREHRLDQGLRRAAHRGRVGERVAPVHAPVPGDRPRQRQPVLRDRGGHPQAGGTPRRGTAGGGGARRAARQLHRGARPARGLRARTAQSPHDPFGGGDPGLRGNRLGGSRARCGGSPHGATWCSASAA